MKTLKDHTIIYDAECPLCNLYTGAFVKTGMLDENGRAPYDMLTNGQWSNVDPVRARNEIALINKKDMSVYYGIDSLFTILGHNMRFFQPLFRSTIFRKAINQLYFFISYNRKVIAPGKSFENAGACTPELNYTYRLAYIIFAWLVTSVVLALYSRHLVPLISETNFLREFLICGGQVVFQAIVVGLVRKDRLIHYLGNMMTLSLIGALLLLPMLFLSSFIFSYWIYLGYFFLVVLFMLIQHMKRVKVLGLPFFISGTWVLYRLLVLTIIL